MSDVTQVERPSTPNAKSSESSPATSERTVVRGHGHQAQIKALTPQENQERYGPTRSSKATAEVDKGKDGQPVGRVTYERAVEDGDDGLARRVATAEIARDMTSGVSAKVGRKQSIEQDDLSLANEQSLTYAKGQGTLAASSEARYREVESDKLIGRRVAGDVGYGKDGLVVGAEGARNTKTADGIGSAVSGKARWDGKEGVSASASHSKTLAAVEGHEMTTAHGVAYAAERAEVSRTTRNAWEQTGDDGEVARVAEDRGLKVGFGKGGVGGEVARRRVVKVGDTTKSHTAKAGYDHETKSVSLSDETVRSDEVSSTKGTRAIGYGKDGFSAKVGHERTLGEEGGDQLTTGTGASYGKGKVTLTRGETVVGADGATEKQVGVTGDIKNKEVGVSGSLVRKGKDGKEVSALSGGAGVKLGEHGLEKASADVAYRRGSTTIAASGGYSFVVGEPEQVERDGKRVWQMTVTKEVAGGANLKVKGIGGGAKASKAQSMTVVRDTRAELIALCSAGKLDAELRKPADARTVSSMQMGEQRSSGSENELKASAEVGVPGVKVGLQFTNGRSQKVTVTKLTGSLVQVQYEDTETSGAGGGVSTGLGGISGSTSTSSQRSKTLEFDLATAAGMMAYEEFRYSRETPIEGATTISTSDSVSKASEIGVNLAGASMSTSSQVTSSVEHDERGKTETNVGTQIHAVSVPLLGAHQKSVGFRLVETNDQERKYMATASVTSTNASDAAEALADATGTHTNRAASGKGSGTWNVSAEFSEAQIDRLIQLIRHDKVVYAELFRQADRGKTLERAVLAAGSDHDKIREAIAEFVSKTGARGLAVIRKALNARPSYDVELVGDKYLTGEKVRVELERKKQSFEARAGGDKVDPKLLADIDEAIAFHRDRAAAIESHSNYPELSHQLRASEVARSREAVTAFSALRRRVADQARAARHRQAEAPKVSAEQSFVEPSEAVSAESATECEPPKPEVAAQASAWRMVETGQARLHTKAIPSMERAFAEARRRHWVHGGAFSLVEPRSKLGFDNFFGSGKHASDYQRAEARLAFGKYRLGVLGALKSSILTEIAAAERTNLTSAPPSAGVVQSLALRLGGLAASFEDVTTVFQTVTVIYRLIEAANPTLRNWEPSEVMPDGYHR